MSYWEASGSLMGYIEDGETVYGLADAQSPPLGTRTSKPVDLFASHRVHLNMTAQTG